MHASEMQNMQRTIACRLCIAKHLCTGCTQAAIHVSVCLLPVIEYSEKQKV